MISQSVICCVSVTWILFREFQKYARDVVFKYLWKLLVLKIFGLICITFAAYINWVIDKMLILIAEHKVRIFYVHLVCIKSAYCFFFLNYIILRLFCNVIHPSYPPPLFFYSGINPRINLNFRYRFSYFWDCFAVKIRVGILQKNILVFKFNFKILDLKDF
jgi:hypothetical protein